jgi:hypothetical protein
MEDIGRLDAGIRTGAIAYISGNGVGLLITRHVLLGSE